MKIILVEDNPENSDMLSRRLKARGFDVVIAEDGNGALERAATESPDLILLDMGLPGMDGREVAQALRNNDKTARIPIIALTAHASEEDRNEALNGGCDEFETKPVNLDRLLEKINGLLGSSAPRKAAEYHGPRGDSDRRHAFLDPLNHIVGFTDLILEELEHLSPDEIRSDLNKVRAAARTLVDLVRSDSFTQTPSGASAVHDLPDNEQTISTEGASILVADDDINNRALIVRNLRKHGYQVSEAIDGDEALQLLRTSHFDLALCDIVMPRMDGVDLLKHIRDELDDRVPVIVISALDQRETVELCLDLDATDFISKPFEPSVLLAKVASVIRRHRKMTRSKAQLV